MLNNLFDESYSPNCQYFDVGTFTRVCSETDLPLFLFCINIRSFSKNSDELLILLQQLPVEPTIVVVTETWFSGHCVLELEGYCGHHVYRTDRRGGGVSVFVKIGIKTRCITEWSGVRVDSEIATVDLWLGAANLRIMAVYRPPDCDSQAFCETIDDMLSGVTVSTPTFVVGDFNLDLTSRDPVCSRFADMMISSSFFPLINLPTHFSHSGTPACIDQIWFNQLGETVSGALQVDISDHFPVVSLFSLPSAPSNKFLKSFRDHSQQSLVRLGGGIDQFARGFIVGSGKGVDNCVGEFSEQLYRLYDVCCPVRRKSYPSSRCTKPWISDALINCINRKYSLFRQYKSGQIEFDIYNTFKNHVTSMVRRSKARYYNNKFSGANGDAGATWRAINALVGRSTKKKVVAEVEVDGRRITQELDIAEHFNIFFSSIASNINNGIPVTDTCPLLYLGERVANSMFAVPSTTSEVVSVIASLRNRSCHITAVPVFIYKHCSDLLSPIISQLFNLSLNSGMFPTLLKAATVVPIHKSGDSSCTNNYRPISMLPILSKIFEKMMLRRLLSFVKSCGLLCDNQFGFRENHSTADALLEFLNIASDSLDDKCFLVSVFLDFSKAFDTVDHMVLLRKLDHMGVRGIMNDWFRSYLVGRTQRVVIGKSISSQCSIQRGVPQGSVLGPVLFLLYINDMHRCCEKLKLIHFADDTTAICVRSDARVLVEDVNADLVNVKEWVNTNRLALNVDKTNYIVLSDSPLTDLPPIVISGTRVTRVSDCKFLGVHFDENLNFKIHVNDLCSRLSRAVGMLNRISGLVSPMVKLKLYSSLIYSRVSYGITVWGRSSVMNACRIDRILNRARKCVSYGYNGNAVVSGTFFTCNSIYDYFALVKFYRIHHSGDHKYFANIISELIPTHEYGTRFAANNLLNTPRLAKTKCQKLFLFQSVSLWNKLPESLKTCQSLPSFKRKLKQHIICA